MTRLERIITKKERLIVGLMSGTSVDSIDAVLVKVRGSGAATAFRQMAFHRFRYPKGYRELVLKNSLPGSGSVDTLSTLHVLSAHFFAEATLALLKRAGIPPSRVDLIGSHGQTVHHLPQSKKIFGRSVRSTLQLAEPSVIAKLTGIVTVGDFRAGDMALGGQGAPLVPYFDLLAFRSTTTDRLLLNLGGIANITLLQRNARPDDVAAMDTGPANMVIDALMEHCYRKPYDRNGSVAAGGTIITPLLSRLMRHPYFRRPLPKSTGREEFGETFVRRLLTLAGAARPQDIVATATALTALTVYDQYVRFLAPRLGRRRVQELIVSGGGSKNHTLMDHLRRLFAPARILHSDALGVASDAKEALCFALLANETVCGIPANIPSVTGARTATVLGVIAQ